MKLKNIFLFLFVATASLHAGPLHDAARSGDIELTALLLEFGDEDINGQDAARWMETPLCYAAENGCLEIVELLVNAGAQIDKPDKYGQAPVNYAIKGGYLDVVQFLFERGADFDTGTENGWTVFHCATNFGHSHILEFLLQHVPSHASRSKGKALLITCDYGETALHVAAKRGDFNNVWTLLYYAQKNGIRKKLLSVKNKDEKTAIDLWHDIVKTATDPRSHFNFPAGYNQEVQRICTLLIDEEKQREVLEKIHREWLKRKRAKVMERYKARGLTLELYLRERALGNNPQLQ